MRLEAGVVGAEGSVAGVGEGAFLEEEGAGASVPAFGAAFDHVEPLAAVFSQGAFGEAKDAAHRHHALGRVCGHADQGQHLVAGHAEFGEVTRAQGSDGFFFAPPVDHLADHFEHFGYPLPYYGREYDMPRCGMP